MTVDEGHKLCYQ